MTNNNLYPTKLKILVQDDSSYSLPFLISYWNPFNTDFFSHLIKNPSNLNSFVESFKYCLMI